MDSVVRRMANLESVLTHEGTDERHTPADVKALTRTSAYRG